MSDSRVEALKKHLRELSDESVARQSQRFFKTGKGEYGEGDVFLGIRVPVLRKMAKDCRDISIREAVQLLKSQFHEERQLSLFMLVMMFQKATQEDKKKIFDRYLKHTACINSWDLVDSSAEHIVGAYLKERDKQPIYQLAASRDLWERRIAILSTFHYIKRNDFTDALRISEIMIKDPEDLIHKAVGWMLREIGKRDMKTEERFLKRHYRVMPRTMLRYAIEKFPEAMRKAYLKGTIEKKE